MPDMPNACLAKESQIVWLAHDAAYGLNYFMRQYAANSVATLAPALLLTLAAFLPLAGFFRHLSGGQFFKCLTLRTNHGHVSFGITLVHSGADLWCGSS